MAVTRDQARRLLTDAEMTLFGESRNPALRTFSARELARRVERTRKLRDKSRDLLQRQRLSTRGRTGSKSGTSGAANDRTARKGEVLEDILQRFQARLEVVQEIDEAGEVATSKVDAKVGKTKAPKTRTAKTATRKSTGPKKSPTRRTKVAGTGTDSAQTRTPGTRAAAARKAAAADSVKAPSATKSTARAKSTRGKPAVAAKAPGAKRPRKSAITPAQALSNTRNLLEAKQQRDSQPNAYQGLDGPADHGQPDPGYQSSTARAKALELHAGEVRLDPIHGSISTRDRKNQGKRDRR